MFRNVFILFAFETCNGFSLFVFHLLLLLLLRLNISFFKWFKLFSSYIAFTSLFPSNFIHLMKKIVKMNENVLVNRKFSIFMYPYLMAFPSRRAKQRNKRPRTRLASHVHIFCFRWRMIWWSEMLYMTAGRRWGWARRLAIFIFRSSGESSFYTTSWIATHLGKKQTNVYSLFLFIFLFWKRKKSDQMRNWKSQMSYHQKKVNEVKMSQHFV